ncbi:NifB/NifX family molybdenum-iron cluster-binding protein [Desulfogranum mediterraneum]|uniref:NifB/NifX family molybdenum-iron cluster-binding protein n=1 Tax=Desulfogranum mediterraneum TaxID=160661 RepID=UPI00042A3D0B|nr:hypothetical protein [Desulfogranum mediterraneum]
MKILLTIRGDFIAPRFDRIAEVMIASCYDRQLLEEPRSILLAESSAEKLCDLALKENVDMVICGAIEEQHYQYLRWKKVRVIDSVIGPHERVLEMALGEELAPGTLLAGVDSVGAGGCL